MRRPSLRLQRTTIPQTRHVATSSPLSEHSACMTFRTPPPLMSPPISTVSSTNPPRPPPKSRTLSSPIYDVRWLVYAQRLRRSSVCARAPHHCLPFSVPYVCYRQVDRLRSTCTLGCIASSNRVSSTCSLLPTLPASFRDALTPPPRPAVPPTASTFRYDNLQHLRHTQRLRRPFLVAHIPVVASPRNIPIFSCSSAASPQHRPSTTTASLPPNPVDLPAMER
jgi:hypothetical protein